MAKYSNPWDRPPPIPDSVVPDSTLEELYSAIGRALSEWSRIEHELCMLFVLLYLGKSGYTAYKLYGGLPSTAARMAALKTTAEAHFSEKPQHAAYTKSVLQLTEKFLARRNDIAHGLIAHRESEGRATLMEPHYSIKHAKDVNYECYEFEAHHILGYAKTFQDLRLELDHAQALLFAPVRRGHRIKPSANTSLTVYVEPFRTELARKLSGLKPAPVSASQSKSSRSLKKPQQ